MVDDVVNVFRGNGAELEKSRYAGLSTRSQSGNESTGRGTHR